MQAYENPPADWDHLVPVGLAMQRVRRGPDDDGLQALVRRDAAATALVMIRGTLPLLGTLATRANVFTTCSDPDFLSSLLTLLARRGVAHAKVGDTMWGLATWNAPPSGLFGTRQLSPGRRFCWIFV